MSDRRHLLGPLLRRDFPSFIQKSFQTLSPGEAYEHNWHIDTIAWHLQQCLDGKIKRLIITVPPRHLKSICASVAFPAFVLGHDPTRKIICAGYSTDLSRKHASDFRMVVNSDWYRRTFPGTRASRQRDTELEFMTTKRGFRYATSVGGTFTGRGGNIIIIDDPIKAGEALSEAERNSVKQWYDNTLYSRLDNKRRDVIILVMQRVHVDDLVGHVLEKEDWVHIDIPAIAEHEQQYRIGDAEDDLYTRSVGELLHESREDRAALDAIKRTMGTYHFSAQYQQCPVPPGGNMIRWDWFRRYEVLPEPREFDRIVQSWDTATCAGEFNDYSVCTTWGVKGPDYYLIDVVRARLEYPHLKRRVVSEARKHGADDVLIEAAGSGISLVQDLRMDRHLRPLGVRPRGDKITRMSSQSAKIEAGRVLLPESAPWLHEFQREVLAFPESRHDDQVDSMSQFLKWISRAQYRERAPRERPSSPRRRSRRERLSGLYYQRGHLSFP